MSRRKLSRRAFLKLAGVSALEAVALSVGSLAYVRKVEPGWIDVAHVPLTLPRLAPEFNGYRIVQISDIHMDAWMTRDRLAHAVEMVNRQQADLVAITGDFVTFTPQQFAGDLVAALSELTSRDATLAILGNHDHWTNAAVVRRVISDSRIIELRNAVHTLRRGEAMLHIAGVDDVWEEHARLDLVLEQLPADGAAILLAHEPDFADESAATGCFDLQLSGHSHGGQVIYPFGGPPILPTYAKKYPVGRYQVSGMIQYTNRGLGMIPPHVRFNCRPEITVFTLSAKREADLCVSRFTFYDSTEKTGFNRRERCPSPGPPRPVGQDRLARATCAAPQVQAGRAGRRAREITEKTYNNSAKTW